MTDTTEGADGAENDAPEPTPDGGAPATADLPESGDGTLSRIPGSVAGIGAGVIAVTVLWLLTPVGVVLPSIGFILLDQAVLFVLYAMVLLGLNLQFGDTGIVNFGPVLFLALGLYGMALMTAVDPAFGTGLGMFWGLGIAVGIVAAVVGGGVLGLSSIRLREDYLAITTLAAAEIFHEIVRVFQNPFGGNNGLVNVPQLVATTGSETGVLRLAENADTKDLAIFLILLGVLLIAYEGFRRLSASPYGRVLRSIQADEDATRGMGKRTFSYKMQAFIYGAAVAGIAGGLMAMYFGSAAPGLVTIDVTVIIWIGMMIGGSGNHRGAIVGLAIVMFLDMVIRLFNQFVVNNLGLLSAAQFNSLRGLLIGVLLVGVIRFRPAGLFGDPERLEVFKE